MKTRNVYLSTIIVAGSLVYSTASAGTLFAFVDGSIDHLATIDTDSLAYTDIGPLGIDYLAGGAAYDPVTETLYLTGGRDNNNLYTVDTTTGAASLVGYHGVSDLFGLAFNTSNRTLYGTQGSASGLFSLDSSTGAATFIANMESNIGGLSYNPNTDSLVGLTAGFGSLCSIDSGTGSMACTATRGYVDENGFTYDPDQNVYWGIDYGGNLYSYDASAGYARTTMLSGIGGHTGLAYRSSAIVPLPTALTFMSLGLVSMFQICRRKAQA